MVDYIRARSNEQKAERLAQIKAALEHQFATRPYHEITLTTLADELGWSRTNLYKYVSTKEEVFLAVAGDKRDAFMGAIMAALPAGCGFDNDTIATVWAGIAAAHYDYFRYSDLLFSVIETNVGIEKLREFKRGYYEMLGSFSEQLSGVLHIAPERVERFTNAIHFHGVGLAGSCLNNPLVKQAVAELGVTPAPVDFQADMRDFVAMMLAWYQGGASRSASSSHAC